MKPNVLYLLGDNAPVVDMLFKDETDRVSGIQVTLAKRHAKEVSTFNTLLKGLELSDLDEESVSSNQIDIYFVTLPRLTDAYAKGSEKFYVKTTSDEKRRKVTKRFNFYTLRTKEKFDWTRFDEFKKDRHQNDENE